MFSHVGIVFWELKASGEFYRKVLEQIGIRRLEDHTERDGTGWLVFGTGATRPFFVVAAGRPSFWTESSTPARSPAHIAFEAPSHEAVNCFHAVGLECGATNNGDPGVRYGAAYSAFLIDLDGNNIGRLIEQSSRLSIPQSLLLLSPPRKRRLGKVLFRSVLKK